MPAHHDPLTSDSEPPWPLLEVAIEPTSKVDHEKLGIALQTLADEDSSFRFSTDPESGQTIIKGMNEVALDSKVDILRRTYTLDIHCGMPQVTYVEKLTRRVEQVYAYKKQMGDTRQFAYVKIVFEPNEAGYLFVSKIGCGAMSTGDVAGVEAGIKSVLHAGILAGFPVVGVKVMLIESAFHGTGSSAPAFEIAARTAFRQALHRGEVILMEPIMNVEVVTPRDYIGSCVGDLRSRRGQVQAQRRDGDVDVINAMVPLINLFGYANQLRSFSQGRATFKMRYARYQAVEPRDGGRPPTAPMALRA